MTTYDFILAKWPAQAQCIIANAYAADKHTAEHSLTKDIRTNSGWPRDVLSTLFIWSNTLEGHEYWKRVAREGGER